MFQFSIFKQQLMSHMGMSKVLRIGTKGLLIILIFCNYLRTFQIPNQQIQEYKQAYGMIYDYVGQSVEATHDVMKFNMLYNLQKDLKSFLHPDTIMEDKYISYHPLTYDSHKVWVANFSFLSFYHPDNPSNERTQTNQFIFNPFPIQKNYYSNLIYPSIYEKYYRIPLSPDLDQKSQMTLGQNNILQKLRDKNATQACIKEASFLKKTISLALTDECLQAIEILNSKNYMHGSLPLKYIVKTDLHQQQGVQFLDEVKVQEILQKYDNGTKCGQMKDDYTFQEFIFNPIFYHDRAFTFRIYVLFASTKPWITYIYTRGMLQVCLRPWSKDELYLSRHLCNALEAKRYWECLKNTPNHNCQNFSDVAEYEEMIPAPWYTNMTDYLIDQNYVKDQSWTETYFYPTIVQKLGYLFNEATSMVQDSRSCSLFGLDFEIDQDLDIWLLDFNLYPSLTVATEERQHMLTQWYDDTVAIIMMHMRQKYLRIKDLIENKLIPHIQNKIKMTKQQIDDAINYAMTDVDVSEGQYLHNYLKVNLKNYKKEC